MQAYGTPSPGTQPEAPATPPELQPAPNRLINDVRQPRLPNKTLQAGRTLLRPAVYWLEDRLSVQAAGLGDEHWIALERHVLDNPPAARATCLPDEDSDWRLHPVSDLTGIIRLDQARVLFLPNRVSQNAGFPGHRAAVFNRHARRVSYPHTPNILGRKLRAAAHGQSYTRGHPPKHLRGRVALLGNATSDTSNYYHFLIDSIGDFLFLQQTLPTELQPDRLLLSHAAQPWQYEILDLLGIERDRIIGFHEHRQIVAEELLVPVRDKGGTRLTPGLCDRIRDAMPPPSDLPHFGRALYITRSDSPRRPVQNEAAVRELVQQHGFEVHALSGMPVAEQIGRFAAADIVVATHGAGLTNLIWCEPGTTVIELLPNRHRVPCFQRICQERGLNYQLLPCPQPGTERGLTAAMDVPLPALAAALQRHWTP